MAKFKIALAHTIFPVLDIEEEEVKKAGGEFVLAKGQSEDEIIEVAKDADAIVTVYAEITRKIIEAAKNCKIIVRTGIGFNNIDLQAASERGIYVANVPDYCFDEVSDHTFALALALARKVVIFDKKVKNNDWNHEGATPIFGFRGQTYGLLGFGNIPRTLATKLHAFGFNVIAYDPYADKKLAEEMNVKLVDLDTLFKESDIMSVHAPLTDETKHVVNEKTLKMMKPTAYVINTSRGPLVDEAALYKALTEKWIAGAAIDVMEQEPPAADHPLLGLDNIIITPHAAFYSEQSSISLRRKAFQEAIRVINGEMPKNCVNKKMLQK